MYFGEVCSGQLHGSPLLSLALCRSRCSVYGVCPLERFCGCGRQEPPSGLPPHPTSLLLCYVFLLLCLWTAATELENSFQFCEATLAAAMDSCLLCVSSVWVLSSAALHVSHICTCCLIPRPRSPIFCSSVCFQYNRQKQKSGKKSSQAFPVFRHSYRQTKEHKKKNREGVGVGLVCTRALGMRRRGNVVQHGLHCPGMNTLICWLTTGTTLSTSGRTSSDTTRQSSIS